MISFTKFSNSNRNRKALKINVHISLADARRTGRLVNIYAN